MCKHWNINKAGQTLNEKGIGCGEKWDHFLYFLSAFVCHFLHSFFRFCLSFSIFSFRFCPSFFIPFLSVIFWIVSSDFVCHFLHFPSDLVCLFYIFHQFLYVIFSTCTLIWFRLHIFILTLIFYYNCTVMDEAGIEPAVLLHR